MKAKNRWTAYFAWFGGWALLITWCVCRENVGPAPMQYALLVFIIGYTLTGGLHLLMPVKEAPDADNS